MLRPNVAALALALLYPSSTLLAQTAVGGSIRGSVSDEQGALLPGVQLTASSPAVPVAFSSLSDDTGSYRLAGLPPGEYVVTAELAGFAKLERPNVVVRAAVNLGLDLTLKVGNVNETIAVNAESPLLESKDATSAVNISGDLQRSLPLSGRRNWSDFLLLVPGAMPSESTVGGATFNFYINGAGSSSHVLQVDGADLGRASSPDVRVVALSTEVIADVHIATAGVDASSPLGQGAVINVATKSGTNQVRGSATLLYQPSQWNASNTPNGISPSVSAVQPDLSIGGPILPGRIWFFGAYRRVDSETGVYRTAAQLNTLHSLDPSFSPKDARNRGNISFVKTTVSLSPIHQVSAFYQHDTNRADVASTSSANPYLLGTGGNGASARLSSIWSPVLTSQLSVSYNDKTAQFPKTSIQGPSQGTYQSVVASAGKLSGVGYLATLGAPLALWVAQPQEKTTVAADVDYFLQKGSGTHSIRAGVYLQPRTYQEYRSNYINGGFANEDLVLRNSQDVNGGMIPFHRRVYDGNGVSNRGRASDGAFYVQDNWSPVNSVTITGGVRVDHIQSKDQIFDVTTQNSTEIGPRLGALYRITSDARNTIRTTWGRIHTNVTPVLATLGTVTVGYQDQYDLNLDGTFDTTFVTPGSTKASSTVAIDPAMHQPFVDETTVGYRHQFSGSVIFDASYVDRRFHDARTTVDVNTIFANGQFVGYNDPTLNQIYLLTNNRWNSRATDALEFAVTKQAASLQFIASYARQWRHVTGTWQPNDPAAIIQPGAFPNDRGIGPSEGSLSSLYNGSSMSLYNMAIFDDGSQWRDHSARVGLAYSSPFGLLAAINYTHQSGSWSGPIFARVAAPDPQLGPSVVVLPNGRNVSNPLADTLRFVGPTRADGQFQLPAYLALNATAGYVFVKGPRRLTTTVELFNLTNHAADQGLQVGGNNLADPNYRVFTNRQRPRAAQLAVRVDF